MSRLAITLSCIALTVGLSSAAGAAGPIGAQRAYAPRGFAAPHLYRAPAFRVARPWRAPGHLAHGRFRHRSDVAAFGDAWPWYGSSAPMGGVTVVERQAEALPVDPYSFENLRARTGIRPAPTPEPALYRLEGPRDRPVTRVVPIVGTEPTLPRGGDVPARSRVAHAETGALLLSVPSR